MAISECTQALFEATPLSLYGAVGSREYYYVDSTVSTTHCVKQAS